MDSADDRDISHPLFVRLYRFNRRTATRRGEQEHRRRLLHGLAGRVLELGAGDGANFALYPRAVREVIALEPEPRFRARAQRAAAEAQVAVSVRAGVAERLPLETGSVDAVVASLVLCTVGDQRAALEEAARVLRPDGELRFYEHVDAPDGPLHAFLAAADRSGVWPALAGGCHPTRDTLFEIAEAGFAVERCERFRFSPSLLTPRLPFVLGVARRP